MRSCRMWLLAPLTCLLIGAVPSAPANAAVQVADTAPVPAIMVSCALSLQYPHMSTGSPGRVDDKGTFSCTYNVSVYIFTRLTYVKKGDRVLDEAQVTNPSPLC